MENTTKIFTLKPGMRLVIGGLIYKVRTVRKNGKCVIQYLGVGVASQHMQPLEKKVSILESIKNKFKKGAKNDL